MYTIQNSTFAPSQDQPGNEYETSFEYHCSIVLGVAFLCTMFIALKRIVYSHAQGGTETTVVTAFYSLILITSALRGVWFLVFTSGLLKLQVSYEPSAMAFSHKQWLCTFLHDLFQSLGSISLFSIFILILVFWADILKKYFEPGAKRNKPMATFQSLVICLILIEIANCSFFLWGFYSSEGMILANASLLAIVSIVCVWQITTFSNQFRTVLKTLGAINQVSTESQVKRIVWITVTGNIFFVMRAFMETWFAAILIISYQKHGKVDEVFNSNSWVMMGKQLSSWDVYVLSKHWSEVAILCLMLYILQSRFTSSRRKDYERVDGGTENIQEAKINVKTGLSSNPV